MHILSCKQLFQRHFAAQSCEILHSTPVGAQRPAFVIRIDAQ
jgi:hypothetical protein